MEKQQRILNIESSDNLAPERISGTHLWCSLWLFFSAWGCVVAILTLSWSAPMLNTSLQCLSRRKESFRKFFSKRIKNSVQVKTFNVLSIRLDSIYAQLQDTDCFLPLLKKYGSERYQQIFQQRRTKIRKERHFFTYKEQLGQ